MSEMLQYEFTDSKTGEKFQVNIETSPEEAIQVARECKVQFGDVTQEHLTEVLENKGIAYDFPVICAINI